MYRILWADLISLTSRHSLSPLDADPSRRLLRGPAPCCEEPWAAVRARRPSLAPCDMRSSLTGAGTRVSRDVAGGGCATVARPDLRGTAPGPRAAWDLAARKGAVCGSHIAQTAPFRHVAAREAWDATPPPACGALWKMAQLGKCARATPRQAGGGVAPRPTGLGRRARPHGKTQ